MNDLTPQEHRLLLSIVQSRLDRIDCRIALYDGNIHSDEFEGMLGQRDRVFQLAQKVKNACLVNCDRN